MRLGALVRSENRGLGNLTWEWAQHMNPARVLVIVPNHPIAQRPERYDRFDRLTLPWDHHRDSTLNETGVREWLEGLDVVYSAETFYDWRMCDWAREQGVRTVCHVMPEYYRHGGRNAPASKPDAWWTPTRWRLATLAPETRVVPVPIATERFMVHEPCTDNGALRSLHIGGKAAAGDRNGTRIVTGATRYLVRDHEVFIRTQGDRISYQAAANVTVYAMTDEADEYWTMYGDADMLVMPRRYAGLSLPVLEAMAAGLAIVMTDCEPQRSEWPISPLPARAVGFVRTGAGPIPLAQVTPRVLAARMDWLADHRDEVRALQRASRAFAASHSWKVLRPTIVRELERVCR